MSNTISSNDSHAPSSPRPIEKREKKEKEDDVESKSPSLVSCHLPSALIVNRTFTRKEHFPFWRFHHVYVLWLLAYTISAAMSLALIFEYKKIDAFIGPIFKIQYELLYVEVSIPILGIFVFVEAYLTMLGTMSMRCKLLHMWLYFLSCILALFKTAASVMVVVNIISLQESNERLSETWVYYATSVFPVLLSLIVLYLTFIQWKVLHHEMLGMVPQYFDVMGDDVDEFGEYITPPPRIRKLLVLLTLDPIYMFYWVFLGCMTAVAQVMAPIFVGKLIDLAISGDTTDEVQQSINKNLLIILMVYIIGSVCTYFRTYVCELVAQHFLANIRSTMFKSLTNLDQLYFDINKIDNLYNRMVAESNIIYNAFKSEIPMFFSVILEIIGSFIVIIYLHLRLSAIVFLFIPLLALSSECLGWHLNHVRAPFPDKWTAGDAFAIESLSKIQTLRSFGGEPHSANFYKTANKRSLNECIWLAAVEANMEGISSMLAYGAAFTVFWYGTKLLQSKEMKPGTLISILIYTYKIVFGFKILVKIYYEHIERARHSAESISVILQTKSTIHQPSTMSQIVGRGALGEIEFMNVSFKYPDSDVYALRNFSLRVFPGQIVALVGPPHSGKSTIIKLLMRFYKATDGCILFGDVHVCNIDNAWFRKMVAYVPPNPVLFDMSVRENIMFGRDIEEKRLQEVTSEARADSFIVRLSNYYGTSCCEDNLGCCELSKGQKIRITLARSILTNPVYLMLDETVDDIDEMSETHLHTAFERAMKGRTVFVIARTLKTMNRAHKVLFMNDGRIVQQGTHASLVSESEFYRDTVDEILKDEELRRSRPESAVQSAVHSENQSKEVIDPYYSKPPSAWPSDVFPDKPEEPRYKHWMNSFIHFAHFERRKTHSTHSTHTHKTILNMSPISSNSSEHFEASHYKSAKKGSHHKSAKKGSHHTSSKKGAERSKAKRSPGLEDSH